MIPAPLIRRLPIPTALVVALVCVVSGVWSAEADSRIRFQRFGIEQGLSNESIAALRQDHLGYLWVGTGSGLARFDGYDFEIFRNDSDRPGNLPNHQINALLEDHLGRLWVGTEQGLALFNRGSQTFDLVPLPVPIKPVPIKPDGQGAKDEPRVECLLEDRDGVLWIGTNQGIFRLPLSSSKPDVSEVRPGFFGLVPGDPVLPDSRVKALAEDQNGTLWIGTRAGLFRLASIRHRHQLDHFTFDEHDADSLHDDEIYTLLADRQGDLWIGAWGGGGLARLAADQLLAEQPSFQRFTHPEEAAHGLRAGIVKSLLEDQDGTLWIGTQLKGIRLLSPAERGRPEPRFHAVEHDPLEPSSVPGSTIRSLISDDRGGIWVGSIQEGLAYHAPSTASVALLKPRPDPHSSSRSNRRSAVWEARDGTVWAGTPGGLDRIEKPSRAGEGFKTRRYSHDPSDPESLAADRVYAVFEDRQERLWIGMVSGGLDRLEGGAEPRFIHHGMENGLQSMTVFSIFEDAAGVLWVGTYLGLHRMEETPGEPPRFVAYRHQEDNPASLSADLINFVTEDHQGRLWIATDGGLDRLEQDRETLVRAPVTEGLIAFQVEVAPDGMLWAATESHGLVRIDPVSGEWRTWTRRDGLADDGCHSLSFDTTGRVWVTSSRRLHRLDPDTGEIRTFTERDGFQVAPYVPNVAHAGWSGDIYLGGTGGLAMFRPQDLNHPPMLSPVALRSFQIANRAIPVDLEGVLPESIDSLDVLVLPPEAQTFSFGFSALSFHRQELVRYAHRLRGYSDEWIETDADHRLATFTNLSPGTYTFEVKARTDVGSWGPQQASLDVEILPYWYEVRWFQASVLLLCLGLPSLWIWFRFRRLEAHRRELQDLVDRWKVERKQRQRWQELSVAGARLAQQTRKPLAVIQRLSERVLSSRDLGPENREHARKILVETDEATARLQDFISYARWEQPETRPVDLGALIERTLMELEADLEAAGVPVKQEVKGTHIMADEEMLTQMLRQVTLNSLEASRPGDLLTFSFETRGGTGRLRVEDRGKGMSRDLLTEVKKPYVTGRSGSQGLGLTVVERLAGQHDWTVEIESEEGTGTRIDFEGLSLAS